jgi:hypothetical protein
MASAESQLAGFLARYTPEIRSLAEHVQQKVRVLYPDSFQLVYDNYNALVIGFGPSERASDAILSIALYPRWVNLFFLQGASLEDPHRLLQGKGKQVRHIVVNDAAQLDDARVRELIAQSLEDAGEAQGRPRLIIKSISGKQRPRRPAESRRVQGV